MQGKAVGGPRYFKFDGKLDPVSASSIHNSCGLFIFTYFFRSKLSGHPI